MMALIKKIKDHMFIIIILVVYISIFIIKPQIGIKAFNNTRYYIKEMLMIMPVVFLLTALLDTWVPKESIMRYLGNKSKTKGIILSFVLGSISAGPIYAAFPICVTLHKKGASVRNIVIILSSWAVIKIPMLINEMKFLGLKFMTIRWILTVVAILIFSWIASKIVRDDDILQKNDNSKTGVIINNNVCIGCTLCTKSYPELFEMQNKRATVKKYDFKVDEDRLKKTLDSCPVNAIKYVK